MQILWKLTTIQDVPRHFLENKSPPQRKLRRAYWLAGTAGERRVSIIFQGRDDAIENIQRLLSARRVESVQPPENVVAFGFVADKQTVLQDIIGGGGQCVENLHEGLELGDFIAAFDIRQIPRADTDSFRTLFQAPATGRSIGFPGVCSSPESPPISGYFLRIAYQLFKSGEMLYS